MCMHVTRCMCMCTCVWMRMCMCIWMCMCMCMCVVCCVLPGAECLAQSINRRNRRPAISTQGCARNLRSKTKVLRTPRSQQKQNLSSDGRRLFVRCQPYLISIKKSYLGQVGHGLVRFNRLYMVIFSKTGFAEKEKSPHHRRHADGLIPPPHKKKGNKIRQSSTS